MISRKLFSIIFAGLLICTFNTSAFAELFSVSVGVPVMHTTSTSWETVNGDVETDGVSGAMAHVKFPIMIGLGLEVYETKLKSPDSSGMEDIKLNTQMIDVFYLTPIPIVNFTIGLGIGNVSLDCDVSGGTKCSDYWEAGGMGSAYQWWGQLGFPIFPFLDIHLSYHSVNAKVKAKDDVTGIEDEKFDGNVIGLGVAFVF